MNQNNEQTETELQPIESPSTELAKVMTEGDPEYYLALLEKKAELAPRANKAINALMAAATYAEDWVRHGDMMCLKSAGAERVARAGFAIRFYNCVNRKEEFTDVEGKGYRYVFEGEVSLADRIVFSQGVYSTRDKFLGYADHKYRAIEDINENNIRNAAYHIFCGNGIKALLGLRNIPVRVFNEIFGESAAKATKVNYGKGTKGGTSQDDTAHQQELDELCIDFANAGQTVTMGEDGEHWELCSVSEVEDRKAEEIANEICVRLSAFTSKEGKIIAGKSAKNLRGKWLDITLNKARELRGE